MNSCVLPPPVPESEGIDQNGSYIERPAVASGTRNNKTMKMSQFFFEKLSSDFQGLEEVGIIDCLLKHPGRILHEIINDKSQRTMWFLAGLIITCMFAYGFVMGTFSGAQQLWMVPLKVVGGILFSLLICLPSLYIFAGLSGSNQTFTQTLGMFLQSLALAGLLLVGFAPVAWIFAQSTNSVTFMGALFLIFWGIGTCIGMELLSSSFSFMNKQQMVFLKIWIFVFITVVLQMMTTLRPLVGNFNGYQLEGKKFFVSHWIDCIDENKPVRGR